MEGGCLLLLLFLNVFILAVAGIDNLYCINSTFITSSSRSSDGGAIYLHHADNYATVNSSYFIGCTASQLGGLFI
jgi:hypothetical protein